MSAQFLTQVQTFPVCEHPDSVYMLKFLQTKNADRRGFNNKILS